MANPDMEQADLRGAALGGFYAPPFHDSFLERRNRLYRERSDVMDRIIRIQRDIMAIERILGS